LTTVSRIDVWPPLPLGIYARKPSGKLPFPLEEPRCRIFSLARQGLFVGIQALGLGPGDEILVPAYHHGSEIEALLRAGIVCRFYEVGKRLEPDEEDLEALLGARVRGLYLTHYLGFPQDAPRWRTWCDEHGLQLIEDAAQAWLSMRDGTPVGSHGDLSIFCLYKTFGLPDGAAVISKSPPEPPRSKQHAGINALARQHGLYLTQQWAWVAGLRRRLGRLTRAGEYDPERDFVLGDPGGAPHAMTSFFLARTTRSQAQATRAANYAFLLERLGRFVPEPFAHLPVGASPFAFPIRWDHKEELLQGLARRGIVALNFWAIPHPHLRVVDFPRAAALRKSIVGLPVHQELGPRELERVVDAVFGELRSSRRPSNACPAQAYRGDRRPGD
jgi:dTDP-4-amino-4,6-dideoxygalactose transaminase